MDDSSSSGNGNKNKIGSDDDDDDRTTTKKEKWTHIHTKKQIVVNDTAAGCSTRNQHHTDGWNKHKQTLRDVNFTISKSFIKKITTIKIVIYIIKIGSIFT